MYALSRGLLTSSDFLIIRPISSVTVNAANTQRRLVLWEVIFYDFKVS